MSEEDSDDFCTTYGSGWCCLFSSKVVLFGALEIHVLSAMISGILLGMVIFLLTKLSVHYYSLFFPPAVVDLPQEDDSINAFTGESIIPRSQPTYSTFDVPPGVVPPRSPSMSIQDTDMEADYTETNREDDLIQRVREVDEDEENSVDYLMELPDRIQSTSSLINVYRQYEKRLGVASKFLPHQTSSNKEKVVTLRAFHFVYLLLVVTWLLVQSIVLFTGAPDTGIELFFDILLYISHGCLSNMIVVMAFFPSDKKKYILAGGAVTLVVVGFASLTAAFYSFNASCEQCSFFFPTQEAFFTYLFLVAMYSVCLVLHYAHAGISPRHSVIRWIWYLLVVNLLATFGSGIVLFAQEDFGFCVINIVMLLYAFLLAPLLHYTLSVDSEFLATRETHSDKEEIAPMVARVYDNLKRHAVFWIPFEELELHERLGIGAAGEVYVGSFVHTPVAVKRLFDNQSKALEDFFKEVTIMSKLSHPNILLFIGVCVRDNGDRFIVTEMMERGSVFDLIHPNLSYSAIRNPDEDNRLTPRRIHRILLQCARGMAYLHSFRPPIVHRDLKSHNLLVDRNWNVKVGDFGLSRPQSMDLMSAAGTPQWTAPEVIRHEHYTTKADVYSFGIIIFEMLSGKIPYIELKPLSAAHRVAYEGLRPSFPTYCDLAYVDFAIELWKENPEDRPDFPHIVQRLENMLPPALPQVDTEKQQAI